MANMMSLLLQRISDTRLPSETRNISTYTEIQSWIPRQCYRVYIPCVTGLALDDLKLLHLSDMGHDLGLRMLAETLIRASDDRWRRRIVADQRYRLSFK